MAFRSPVASSVTYPGASDAPAGAPENSVLLVRGVGRASEQDLRALLGLSKTLRIPVDSLACVIAQESAFDPSRVNHVPAAGWIQVTTSAGLPGLSTPEAIRAVATTSGASQCSSVLLPYFSRLDVAGADPGRLYLSVFWPAALDAADDFAIAAEGGPHPAVYAQNAGLDVTHDGVLTVADVKRKIAGLAAESGGLRRQVGPAPSGGAPVPGPSPKPVPATADGGGLLLAGALGLLAWRLWHFLQERRA